jgi:hypothetical protein
MLLRFGLSLMDLKTIQISQNIIINIRYFSPKAPCGTKTVQFNFLVSIVFIVNPEGDFYPIEDNIHTYKIIKFSNSAQKIDVQTVTPSAKVEISYIRCSQ